MTHKDFTTGSTAAVCGGITVVDMPNTVPPTADAEQVKSNSSLGEPKSLVDFGVTGVVVQTSTKDMPMAAAGAIGFKIFFGETIGNLPFPDDGMCMEAFDYIAQSKLPLGIHAENRQIMAYCTNKLKTEGKNDARHWEASRPDICEPSPCTTLSSSPRPSAQASRFPHELQAGGLYGARCQGARLECTAKRDRTTCCASPTIWIKSALC